MSIMNSNKLILYKIIYKCLMTLNKFSKLMKIIIILLSMGHNLCIIYHLFRSSNLNIINNNESSIIK